MQSKSNERITQTKQQEAHAAVAEKADRTAYVLANPLINHQSPPQYQNSSMLV